MLLQFLHPPHASDSRHRQSDVFYAGFSSMGSMGLLPHPASLLITIIAAAKALNLRAVLVTSGDDALEGAVAALWRKEEQQDQGEEEGGTQKKETDSILKRRDTTPKQQASPHLSTSPLLPPRLLASGRVLVLHGPVSHKWLFPRCCFVLHHAGSGTTAAALRAGVPQLLCPFILDQHYWAHRLCYLGVAPAPLHPSDLMPLDPSHQSPATTAPAGTATVVSRFAAALSAGMRERAQELSREIQTEDGVSVALATIKEELFK
ncbi:unnamed protein product [Closterium sp. Naga37s-1]|nr:unnamed protein product [Closterium sp. Naga37s-1]